MVFEDNNFDTNPEAISYFKLSASSILLETSHQ